jgi:hypothetical protein
MTWEDVKIGDRVIARSAVGAQIAGEVSWWARDTQRGLVVKIDGLEWIASRLKLLAVTALRPAKSARGARNNSERMRAIAMLSGKAKRERGERNRATLVDLLERAAKPMRLLDLAHRIGMTPAGVYQHLAHLRKSGAVGKAGVLYVARTNDKQTEQEAAQAA